MKKTVIKYQVMATDEFGKTIPLQGEQAGGSLSPFDLKREARTWADEHPEAFVTGRYFVREVFVFEEEEPQEATSVTS